MTTEAAACLVQGDGGAAGAVQQAGCGEPGDPGSDDGDSFHDRTSPVLRCGVGELMSSV
jgi:hypothetical protein